MHEAVRGQTDCSLVEKPVLPSHPNRVLPRVWLRNLMWKERCLEWKEQWEGLSHC